MWRPGRALVSGGRLAPRLPGNCVAPDPRHSPTASGGDAWSAGEPGCGARARLVSGGGPARRLRTDGGETFGRLLQVCFPAIVGLGRTTPVGWVVWRGVGVVGEGWGV